ncbi:hypothetical protein NUW54_g2748 [Trametes sanguinea]|uniref:Uncharacterized protein n=1 Tax=Trametes sanguinea TaxID=158606 RepID=A0ACC1Q3Y3_9APHY|nr:hypothetical protein NUW54_g2748 [Trametes sanguinea]
MEAVLVAMRAVEAAVRKKKMKERAHLAEVAGHVSSHLVLLKLQTISAQVSQKLAAFLRESLALLYGGIGLPALVLASSIFRFAYHERLLPTIGNVQREEQRLWESVLHALLAGVLDFLDANDNQEVKSSIGEALFSALGETCFSLSAPKTDVDLRCTAYNIMCDSAAHHQVNQQKLRSDGILGGERLGSCIWRTKDYLAMEGLLNLFARALPSTHNSSAGRVKRTAYIHSVFQSCAPPEVVSAGTEIAELLENVPTSNWDETSLKIVEVISRANITYPQPLTTQEVVVCGYTYPSDRVYVEDKTFLANVLLGDDQYDSLEIAYSAVNKIITAHTQRDNVQVTWSLNDYPKLGKDRLKPKNHVGAELGAIEATFSLKMAQLDRFFRALVSRGLAHLLVDRCKSLYMPKLSLAAAPTRLEVDSTGRFTQELSQEERIEAVSQCRSISSSSVANNSKAPSTVYKTNEPSDDIVSSEDVHACGGTTHVGSVAVQEPVSIASASTNVPLKTQLAGHQGSSHDDVATSSEPLFDATAATDTGKRLTLHAAAFGLSDEELSEISDCDSPLPPPRSRILQRSSTSASLVRGRISFQPLPKTELKDSKTATRITRGTIGNVVVDSDDDYPPAVLVSSSVRRKRKAALQPKPTLEESQTNSAMVAESDRLSPTVPVSQIVSSPLHGDETLVSSDIPAKVLRFSDIPAPDFNAPLSSPAIVAKSALKSAFAKRPPKSQPVALPSQDLRRDSLAGDNNASVSAATGVDDGKASTTAVSEILNDLGMYVAYVTQYFPNRCLVPASSSPTPVAKKAIKANLRNRGKAEKDLGETTKVATGKRKSPIPDEGDAHSLDNRPKKPNKRVRKSAALNASKQPPASELEAKPEASIVEERPASQVLSPRCSTSKLVTRKYHARKERTPVAGVARKRTVHTATKVVDYDALPSPPRTSGTAVQSSSPVTKNKKAVNAKKETPESPPPIYISDSALRGKTRVSTEASKVLLRTPKTGPMRAAKAKSRGVAVVNVQDYTPDDGHSVDDCQTLSELCWTQGGTLLSIPDVPPAIDSVVVAFQVEPRSSEPSDMSVPAISSVQEAATARAASLEALPKGAPLKRYPQPVATGKNMKGEEPNRATTHSSATPWDAAMENAAQVDLSAGNKMPFAIEANIAIDHDTVISHEQCASTVSSTPAGNNKIEAQSGKLVAHHHEDNPVRSPAILHQPTSAAATRSGVTVAVSVIIRSVCADTDATALAVPQMPDAVVPKVKNEVEAIDLTVDSPLLPARSSLPRAHPMDMPVLSTHLTDSSTADIGVKGFKLRKIPIVQEHDDVLTYLQNAGKGAQEEPSRRPLALFENQPYVDLRGNSGGQEQMKPGFRQRPPGATVKDIAFQRHTRLAWRSEEDHHDDTPVQDIMRVLMRLHEVVLANIEHKFESVRHSARLSRNELLQSATADLESMRAQRVKHFNMLVDLEAEYATAGRGLIQESEDWAKVNAELARGVKQVVEQHDRAALSKKMPTSLIVLPF